MSEEIGAVSENSSVTLAREFIEIKLMDMQKEWTRFVEGYVFDLSRRISILESNLGCESNPIVLPRSEQTKPLPRSEAAVLDKTNTSDGLKHLEDELSKANIRIKDLEDHVHQIKASQSEHFRSSDDSFRNLVRTELDAILSEMNFKKPLQDASQNQRSTSQISPFSSIGTWHRRGTSHDESEELKLDFDIATTGQVLSASDQEDVEAKQCKTGTLRGVRGDSQPKSFDAMLEEESLQKTTIRHGQPAISNRSVDQPISLESRVEEATENIGGEMQYAASTRTINQPMSLEGMLEGTTGQNTAGKMQFAASTRTLEQPMSLEGMLEGDTGQNTAGKMQFAASTRTLEQPMSLEGMLEGLTLENTSGEMNPATSTRTLVQPMSLEGQLEGDTGKNTPAEMQCAISTRTLVQPMSLEGRLEGDTDENIAGKMQPATSTRTLDQPMSLEAMMERETGKKLEEATTEAASEIKPLVPSKDSGTKPKPLPKSKHFLFFHRKSSKVPNTEDPDKSQGLAAGPSEVSKAKENSKGKKS